MENTSHRYVWQWLGWKIVPQVAVLSITARKNASDYGAQSSHIVPKHHVKLKNLVILAPRI